MRHFIALAVTLAAVSGCAHTPPPLSAADGVNADRAYHLDTGDKVRITVYNEPNLTGEYNVTPSGNIAFPLVGVVAVKGATIEEATMTVTAKLSAGFVKDPKVSIEVLNYRPYYILGEVTKPGEYPFVSGITIEQAVAAAGGYTYRANQKKVFVRRVRGPGERSVSVRQQAVPVLPGDTIRVGERYF